MMREKEKGFAVAWGVLLLSMVLFFMAGVYALGDRKAKGTARELLSADLRLAAESGLVAAAAELTENEARRNAVNSSSDVVLFSTIAEGDITTYVYLKKDGAGGFHGQATASTKRLLDWDKNSKGTIGTRALGRITQQSGKYTVTYWEH